MTNIMSNVRNSRPHYPIKRQPSYSVVLEEPDEIEISLFQQGNSSQSQNTHESSTKAVASTSKSRSNSRSKKPKEETKIEKHESSGDDSTVVGTDATLREMEARLLSTQKQLEEVKAEHAALVREHARQREVGDQNEKKAEQELAEQAKKSNAALLELQKKLETTNNLVTVLSTSLAEESSKRKEAEAKLTTLQSTMEKTELILNATRETEVRLTAEAKSLLSTLQMSIYDGDSLYSMLKKGYESNVAKKVATKGFVSASSTLLKESLGMLEQLSSAVEEHNTSILKASGEVGESFQMSASAVTSLLNTVKEQIKLMADTMTHQVSGEGGMNTIVSEASSKIREHLQAATKTIDDGEMGLSSTCSEMRTRLLQASETLSALKSSHGELKQTNISSLEASFFELKRRLAEVMNKTEEAITHAETVRRSAHADQVKLISRWKQELSESCATISTKAESHSDALEVAMKTFIEGMEHHTAAGKSLKDQITFLTESGKSHFSKVSKQESLILANVILLDKAFKKQCEIRSNSLQTILSKVQDIIKTEMNELSNLAEEQFNAFKTNAFELKKANTTIAISAKDILTRIGDTNTFVSGKVEALQQNDLSMLQVAQETKKGLQDINGYSKMHQESLETYSLLAQEGLEKLANLDGVVINKLQSIAESNKECTAYLEDSAHPDSVAAMGNMWTSGTCITEFASDSLLLPSLDSLDCVMQPRQEIIKQVKGKHEEISMLLDGQHTDLTRISEDHKSAGSENIKKVYSLTTEYETKTAGEIAAKAKSLERELVKCVSTFSDGQSDLLSSVSDKTKEVGTKMVKFATTDLKMKEEIPAVPDRKFYSYSQQLTQTPSDELILSKVGPSVVAT